MQSASARTVISNLRCAKEDFSWKYGFMVVQPWILSTIKISPVRILWKIRLGKEIRGKRVWSYEQTVEIANIDESNIPYWPRRRMGRKIEKAAKWERVTQRGHWMTRDSNSAAIWAQKGHPNKANVVENMTQEAKKAPADTPPLRDEMCSVLLRSDVDDQVSVMLPAWCCDLFMNIEEENCKWLHNIWQPACFRELGTDVKF